ncbi:hypothetical protein BaRGS_00025834, partial [Batillaria attramentaria]
MARSVNSVAGNNRARSSCFSSACGRVVCRTCRNPDIYGESRRSFYRNDRKVYEDPV